MPDFTRLFKLLNEELDIFFNYTSFGTCQACLTAGNVNPQWICKACNEKMCKAHGIVIPERGSSDTGPL